MSRVTQTDIAKALNLSPTTVGLVVGNANPALLKRLSKETIERVRQKAEEMGYVPDRAAQTMRQGSSKLIILLNMTGLRPSFSRAPFYIGRDVVNAGFDFQVIEAFWWPKDGKRIIDLAISLCPRGVIVIGSEQTKMDFARFSRHRIHLVSIAQKVNENVPLFRHDARRAIYEITSQCIALKRERIGLFLRRPVNDSSWQQHERRCGFEQALEEAGWETSVTHLYPETLPTRAQKRRGVVYLDTNEHQYFNLFPPAYKTAEWIKDSSDALVCGNDEYALSALTYCLRNNISVPKEVCLSGFDNQPFTEMGAVPITSVEPPVEEICSEATAHLLRLIHGEKVPARERVFPCKVIWRESLPQTGVAGQSPKPFSIS